MRNTVCSLKGRTAVDLTNIARSSAAVSHSPPADSGLSTSPVRNMNVVSGWYGLAQLHTDEPAPRQLAKNLGKY